MIRKFKSPSIILFLLIQGLIYAGCSSTRVLNSWKAALLPEASLQNVFIVGVAVNELNRRMFEDSFSAALKAAGVTATVSYAFVEEDKAADKDSFRTAAGELGIHHVLVTHMVGSKMKEVYHPGETRILPYPYYSSYGRYYPTVFTYVHEPGYYTTHEHVKLESNLYEVNSEKLLWSATTETVDPEDTRKVADELSKVLVGQMKADGLIHAAE